MVFILSDIREVLQWLLDQFMDKVPRPVKIIIFLLFILLLGSLISLFLQMIGIHCSSQNIPQAIDPFKVATNFNIIFASKDIIKGDNISVCDIHPEKCGSNPATSPTKLGWDCFYFAKPLANGNYQPCNDTNYSSSCRYFYREGRCFNCTEAEICLDPNGGFWCNRRNVCFGDARPLEDGLSLACKWRGVGSCDIPKGYVWNSTVGAFFCEDDTICGDNATDAATQVDFLLKRAGAVDLYDDKNTNSYKHIVGITCDSNLNPQLAFFGIPLFNFKIWVLLMVVVVMFLFLSKIRTVSN